MNQWTPHSVTESVSRNYGRKCRRSEVTLGLHVCIRIYIYIYIYTSSIPALKYDCLEGVYCRHEEKIGKAIGRVQGRERK